MRRTASRLLAGTDAAVGLWLAVLLGGAPAQAQVPALIKDVALGTGPSSPSDLTVVGNTLFFAASDTTYGRELWKSDGTAGGTVLVKDIVAGTSGSSPVVLTNVGGTLFFWTSGGALWKSDGTAVGTVLVKSGVGAPFYPTAAASGVLFFVRNDVVNGEELWRSDGTDAGTFLLKDINPGSGWGSPRSLTNVNGTLFFSAWNGTQYDLWKSDGTTAGTVPVKAVNFPNMLTNVNGTLFFRADDPVHGIELWKSDGTPAGTVLADDIVPGAGSSSPIGLINLNGTLHFWRDLSPGLELWKYDAVLGAVPVSTWTSVIETLQTQIAEGGRLYCVLTESNGGAALWTSTGTDLTFVASVSAGSGAANPFNLTGMNGAAYFTAATDAATGRELWKSDGTAGGTVLVADINPGAAGSNPSSLVALNGTLFLSASDPFVQQELWKSDGTSGGTAVVKDIQTTPATANPANLTNVNGTLFFTADDGFRGIELWKSDGTAKGTVLVKDINLTASSTPQYLVNVNGTLFFSADDGVTGRELWKSDGTAAGTVLVKDLVAGSGSGNPSMLARVNGTLFFFAPWLGSGPFPWKSDGTAAGTVLVSSAAMLGFFPDPSVPRAQFPAGVNGLFFFWGYTTPEGGEPWRSDGTAGGTFRLADINPGGGTSYPMSITDVNGTAFFTADMPATDRELWKSDGTSTGLVLDLISGSATSGPNDLTNVNGTLFFRATDGAHGYELWKSDGTAGGTVLVSDISLGSSNSTPHDLVNVNGTLYFGASDGVSGDELWKSDGTSAGTVLVRDILPGGTGGFPNHSQPMSLTNVNGTLYLVANTFTAGYELWRSDGTAEGTVLVSDIVPGPVSSGPTSLTAVGPTLYFAASDPVHGRELWGVAAQPGPALSAIPAPLVVGGASTLSGSNFSAGSVIKLYVATAAGTLAFGPYTPTSWSPVSLTWDIPASIPLGNGFAGVQVVNTDTGYQQSNVVGALLLGDAADNLPSITAIDGVPLAAVTPGVPVAHVETVVSQGGTVTLSGTGFSSPLVNLFTATGNVGPLTPSSGWTSTSLQVVIPAATATGPANFQVVNAPYTGNVSSNAVSTVVGARPTIVSVVVNGQTVTVNGTGFCILSVINLFNLQGQTVVNLGGLVGPTPRVPLTLVNDTQFTFTVPAGATAGAAFIEVLNPPFIPYSSSGNDPDGAFTTPSGLRILTNLTRPMAPGRARSSDESAGSSVAEEGIAPATETVRTRVTWIGLSGADTDGVRLWRSGGDEVRRSGARSAEALVGRSGSIAWTVPAGAGDVAVGLSHGDSDAGLADIDFGLRTETDGALVVYESGGRIGVVGSAAAGDELRIVLDDDAIAYWLNETLVWQSLRRPVLPLQVGVSLGGRGAHVDGVWMEGRRGVEVPWRADSRMQAHGTRAIADGPSVLASSLAVERGAVAADLVGDAAIGFGRTACDYCLARVGPTLQVWHAGQVRGMFPAMPGGRHRVELDSQIGVVRYRVGETLLVEAPTAGSGPLPVRGWLGGRGAVLDTVVVDSW